MANNALTTAAAPPVKANADKLPQVTQKHPEYRAMINTWTLVADCVAGEEAVKAKGKAYLPAPATNDGEDSKKVKQRYDDYVMRACYFNATGRTLKGLVGEVFSKDSTVEVLEPFKPLMDNLDGFGRSGEQLAKEGLSFALQYGRGGYLADYPNQLSEDGKVKQTTIKDLANHNVRPRVLSYPPQAIINWRLKNYGALSLLGLVVLEEANLEVDELEFEETTQPQYRVLRLTKDRQYTVELWREDKDKKAFVLAEGPFTPQDKAGKPFDVIPFSFYGPDDNGASPNLSPLADIARVSIAWYRNSADEEDSINIVGQPTLFIAGVTEDWAKNVWKGKIRFGSRSCVPLEAGATAEILQADPNTMVKDAMDRKERLMVALGAQLVEQKDVQETATASSHNQKAKMSILGSCSKNVGEALTQAIVWAHMFIVTLTDADLETISYELNTDYDVSRMSPEEQQAVVASWQAEAIDFEEMRGAFKRGGVAWKDDKEVKSANEAAREDLLGVRQVGGKLAPDPGIDPKTGEVKPPPADPNKLPPKNTPSAKKAAKKAAAGKK